MTVNKSCSSPGTTEERGEEKVASTAHSPHVQLTQSSVTLSLDTGSLPVRATLVITRQDSYQATPGSWGSSLRRSLSHAVWRLLHLTLHPNAVSSSLDMVCEMCYLRKGDWDSS